MGLLFPSLSSGVYDLITYMPGVLCTRINIACAHNIFFKLNAESNVESKSFSTHTSSPSEVRNVSKLCPPDLAYFFFMGKLLL